MKNKQIICFTFMCLVTISFCDLPIYIINDSENYEKTSGAANNDGRLFDRSDDLMTKIGNIENVLNELVENVSVLNKTQIR
ncbi:hypothetical protein JTB14_000171 [Gonioctena quinquepunctata]|nr:hypothetical protein JTB14_000171 [Gonioctena quinquepunctata]